MYMNKEYIMIFLIHIYLIYKHIFEIYCKCIIFSVYDIWRTLDFLLFSMDLIWFVISFHCTYSNLYINAHLAVFLIWRRDTTAKGA